MNIFDFLYSIVLDDLFRWQNLKEYNPRLTALRAIGEKYRDRSEVLDLLLDRSQKEPDDRLREYAQEQLVIWRARTVYWDR